MPLSASSACAQPKATGRLRPAWPKGAPKATGTSSLDSLSATTSSRPLRVLAGRGEIADDESLDGVEGAAEQELGEEAVEAVRRLVEVLEQDDAAVEAGLQQRAAHRREGGEVAARERRLHGAAHRAARAPSEMAFVGWPKRSASSRCSAEIILSELRTHRPMDRGDACPPPELVQDGRVAVADDELLRDAPSSRGEAQQAVAAAGEDQRPWRRSGSARSSSAFRRASSPAR